MDQTAKMDQTAMIDETAMFDQTALIGGTALIDRTAMVDGTESRISECEDEFLKDGFFLPLEHRTVALASYELFTEKVYPREI